jgi:hypothetical protein
MTAESMLSAIRKLAAEAADNELLARELAAGIARVKSAKTQGIRTGNWLSLRQAQALLSGCEIGPSWLCFSVAVSDDPR